MIGSVDDAVCFVKESGCTRVSYTRQSRVNGLHCVFKRNGEEQ